MKAHRASLIVEIKPVFVDGLLRQPYPFIYVWFMAAFAMGSCSDSVVYKTGSIFSLALYGKDLLTPALSHGQQELE